MNRKGLLKILTLLAFVICLAGVLSLSSCGGSKVTDIYVASANAPRLNYVQGQELDLSSGILTIVLDGQEEKVPLSSEEVTISGYDANVLGDQTLTIAYKELTTSITVNVIPRIVAEGYETNYFVDDEFNKEMGRLKIANDDASTFFINIKDNKVKLVSFDSKQPGTTTATVSYTKDNNTYECSFDVTVYEHSNITFVPPTKTNYQSHEKNVDITGGYFVVVSSDGKLTKNVSLKEEMIKNFDLSEATMANRKTPFEKTLNVEYLPGKTFDYKIKIVFSGISVVDYYAKEVLADINWSEAGDDLASAMSSEQKEATLDAINTFLSLIDTDKQLIPASSKEAVVRAAAIVANENYQTQLDGYSEQFYITDEMQFILNARDFDEICEIATEMAKDDAEINVYATILRKLVADFPDLAITDDKDLKTYISVYSESQNEDFVATLNHMIKVYNTLKDIPDDWKVEDLEQYASKIEMATNMITQAKYYGIKSNFYKASGAFYTEILSPWRTNDDLFEIIWSYYLYVKEDGDEFIRKNLFGPIPMPELAEKWYADINDAIYLTQYYQQYYSSSAILSDVSQFMYYYYKTLESAAALKESDDQFSKDIYNALNGDYTTRSYLYSASFGYLFHVGALIDSEEFMGFWSNYYDLLKLYLSNELNAEANKEQFVSMFESFQGFSPAELYGFMASLNLMYDSLDRNKMDANGNTENYYMLSYSEQKAYSIFAVMLRDYYSSYLTEANKELFTKLLRAMENYAISHVHPVALERFNGIMAEFVAEFDALNQGDKDNFTQYFGESYAKYRAIWEYSNENSTVTLTEEENALLSRLLLAIERYHIIMNSNTETNTNYSGLLFAIYAEARDAYNAFFEVATDEAKTYFYNHKYTALDKELTLDVYFYLIDLVATNSLTRVEKRLMGENGESTYVTAWDLFNNYAIDDLLVEMYVFLHSGLDSSSVTLTDEYVISLINKVSSLNKLQVQIFQYLGTSDFYYSLLREYLETKLSEEGLNVAINLIEAERLFANLTGEQNEAKFNELMAAVSTSYEALSDSDKAFLNSMYEKYIAEYNKNSADA